MTYEKEYIKKDGTIIPVEVVIRNFGIDTLTTVPVTYRVDVGIPIQEIWTGVLPPNHTANFIFLRISPWLSPNATAVTTRFVSEAFNEKYSPPHI